MRPLGCIALGLGALLGCTDADIYSLSGKDPAQVGRMAVAGTLCTDAPGARGFPIKFLLAIDAGNTLRGLPQAVSVTQQAAQSFFISVVGRPESVALETFAASAKALTPGFAVDLDLQAALAPLGTELNANPSPESRYDLAISMASALISGDMVKTSRGERQRTRYVVGLFVHGPPSPQGAAYQNNSLPALKSALADLKALVARELGGELSVQLMYLPLDPTPAQTEAALNELASVADGQVIKLTVADPLQISFARFDQRPLTQTYSRKQIIVFNRNARPNPNGMVPDSDGDGLSDEEEAVLGTRPDLADTDGDGLNDKLEVIFAPEGTDPLVNPMLADPANHVVPFPGCDPLTFRRDSDGDGLNDCEEHVLGTDPSLVDTDGDGIPDLLEFLMGTNYLERDDDQDPDLDGAQNAEELRVHGDPRASDLQLRSDQGYRYRELDLGWTDDKRECVDLRVANIHLMHTLALPLADPDMPGQVLPGQFALPGMNQIYVYLVMAPTNAIGRPGSAKLAVIPMQLMDKARKPPQAVIDLHEEDFQLLK